MEGKSIGAIVKAAVIAGLIAAVLVAGFHFFVTEPVLDRAIEFESQMSHGDGNAIETALVSRDAQRAGLFLGFVMYGLIWALLFGVVYHLGRSLMLTKNVIGRGLLLALAIGWSVAIFPFMKYPANPPGVGEPETVQYRQALYLAFIALSILITLLAFAIHRHLSRRRPSPSSKHLKWIVVSIVYIVGAVTLYVGMPANPDPIHMPNELIWSFRVISLAGLALFWMLFAGGFAWLIGVNKAGRMGHRPVSARPMGLR